MLWPDCLVRKPPYVVSGDCIPSVHRWARMSCDVRWPSIPHIDVDSCDRSEVVYIARVPAKRGLREMSDELF